MAASCAVLEIEHVHVCLFQGVETGWWIRTPWRNCLVHFNKNNLIVAWRQRQCLRWSSVFPQTVCVCVRAQWSDPNIRLRSLLSSSPTTARQKHRWQFFIWSSRGESNFWSTGFALVPRDEGISLKSSELSFHHRCLIHRESLLSQTARLFAIPVSYPWLDVSLEITSVENHTATHYRNDVMTAFRFVFFKAISNTKVDWRERFVVPHPRSVSRNPPNEFPTVSNYRL